MSVSNNLQSGSMGSRNYFYTVKAMYLGNEPMGELLEGENGSDAIQIPLRRTILRTDGVGEEVDLSMTNDSLLVTFVNPQGSEHMFDDKSKNRIALPIDMLAYCGALRQLPRDKIREREFETLDKSPNDGNHQDPPLFVTIFRSFENESTLFCHSFVMRKDDEAMELVKLVMEVYYNLIRLQELEDQGNDDQYVVDSPTLPSNLMKCQQQTPSVPSSMTNIKSDSLPGEDPANLVDYELTMNAAGQMTMQPAKVPTAAKFGSMAYANTTNYYDNNNDALNVNLQEALKNIETINLNTDSSTSAYLSELLDMYNKTPTTLKTMPGGSSSANMNSIKSMSTSKEMAEKFAGGASQMSSGQEKPSGVTTSENGGPNSAAGSGNMCKEVVSAGDLISKTIEHSQYQMQPVKVEGGCENRPSCMGNVGFGGCNSGEIALPSCDGSIDPYANLELNHDEDPIIIKKPNNEQLVYKQNVFIRWLQPPTPPPPAPIIIREVQEPPQEALPPLVIYKQAPRPPTPPPLVIRERPPSPLNQPCEPLVIERRIAAEPQPRKIIIEHLPAPPPKPRDIILEKWLPKEYSPRTVYVQKTPRTGSQLCYPKSYYELVEPKQKQDLYEVMDRSRSSGKRMVRHLVKGRRSTSNELSYSPSQQIYSPCNVMQQPPSSMVCQPDIYCMPQVKKPKVTGYRIIRQIIPGPNATAADIEKALARSQRISSSYANSKRIYSPSFESNGSGCYPIYSTSQLNASPVFSSGSFHTQTGGKAPGKSSGQQSYSPQMFKEQQSGGSSGGGVAKKDVYRSSSIDNFI